MHTDAPSQPGETAETPAPPLLRLRGISKSYGAVQALADVDFHVNRGEVVGLLGDNGAGKSTLIKIIAGVVRPDRGIIEWDGKPSKVRSRHDSQALGIEPIYQDSALVDTMSITRNIFMGREITGRLGFLRHTRMRREAMRVLDDVVQVRGIGSPAKLVSSLSGGQKQAVAIARAVYFHRSLLLLDEPTNALAARVAEELLKYLRKLREEGLSNVLVTHDLYHAHQLCDRFVLISRGRVTYEAHREETSLEELTRRLAA